MDNQLNKFKADQVEVDPLGRTVIRDEALLEAISGAAHSLNDSMLPLVDDCNCHGCCDP